MKEQIVIIVPVYAYIFSDGNFKVSGDFQIKYNSLKYDNYQSNKRGQNLYGAHCKSYIEFNVYPIARKKSYDYLDFREEYQKIIKELSIFRFFFKNEPAFPFCFSANGLDCSKLINIEDFPFQDQGIRRGVNLWNCIKKTELEEFKKFRARVNNTKYVIRKRLLYSIRRYSFSIRLMDEYFITDLLSLNLAAIENLLKYPENNIRPRVKVSESHVIKRCLNLLGLNGNGKSSREEKILQNAYRHRNYAFHEMCDYQSFGEALAKQRSFSERKKEFDSCADIKNELNEIKEILYRCIIMLIERVGQQDYRWGNDKLEII